MNIIYTSVFAKEIPEHLALLCNAGRHVSKAKCYLRSLDRFLADSGVTEKILGEDLVVKWLASRPVKSGIKKNMLAEVKRFAKYLSTLGFSAQVPETPRLTADYVPYIFSDEEFGRIICASVLFPVLLRLLYGCGLRLGEGLALTWNDIDLDSGVITVRSAKNRK